MAGDAVSIINDSAGVAAAPFSFLVKHKQVTVTNQHASQVLTVRVFSGATIAQALAKAVATPAAIGADDCFTINAGQSALVAKSNKRTYFTLSVIASGAATTFAASGEEIGIPSTDGGGLQGPPGAVMTGAEILAALLPVDGAGSGLDADLLDGVSASGFVTATTPEAQGALRDGTTDDTTAFNAAQATLTAGGVVTLSKGTYKTKINPTMGGVTYKGAGMWATTLIPPAATTWQIQWTGAFAADVAFEDMAFDYSALSTGAVALLEGEFTSNVRFTRCRFYNVPEASAYCSGLIGLVVEDCLFHTSGNPLKSQGILLTSGTSKVRIRGNRFLYCNTGVSGATRCDDIQIHDNYFDQGWWLGASVATGTGGTVTYTATVLTDTGANFATLPSNGVGYYVRTMATRRTNSGATVSYGYDQNTLVDTAASFVADGVLKGEIIRSGSIFGVVESVISATVIQVEEWLSTTTYLPVRDPADAATYTAYKIAVGYISAGTATTLTINSAGFPRFLDLDGASVTPAAGTLYEVIPHGIYPIHLDTCKGAKVNNNILKRGWADQISMHGNEAQVIGNTIEEGQDYGVTCHGSGNIVALNRVRHQGTVGITCGSPQLGDEAGGICVGNDVSGCQWTNVNASPSIAGIVVWGSNTVVTGNKVDGGNRAQSLYGLTVFAYNGETVDGCLVTGNKSHRHATKDLFLDQLGTGVISNLTWYGNTGTFGRGAGVAATIGPSTGWAMTNVTTDKVIDANATSIDELADGFGTLVNALIAQGVLGA